MILGAVLLTIAASEVAFLNSKGHRRAINARASEDFGKALDRIGIPTQAEASSPGQSREK
jgi:hypothetical protein